MTVEPNDPTRSGVSLPAGAVATLSLNEIESLCLKAARGAGMSWGLAEEAGFAAAWLAKRGIDGPTALLSQLKGAAGLAWGEICPVVEVGAMRPLGDGCLCPIALGAALCDFAALPEMAMTQAPLQVGPVSQPILLLPFLSALAAARGEVVEFNWSGETVIVSGQGQVAGDILSIAMAASVVARISLCPSTTDFHSSSASAVEIPADTLRQLNDFAICTTVPPSEKSRSDAGAGTSDND